MTLRRAALVLAAAVVGGAGTAAAGPAAAVPEGRAAVTSRVVSGPSPYGACAEGFGRGAEASPALVDTGRGRVLVAWQQDATHGGGGDVITKAAGLRSTAGAFSGGVCGPDGGPQESAGAPSLAVGPDGTAWAASFVNGESRAQVLLSRRSPGGAWSTSVVAAFEPATPATTYLPATVAVDPRDARRVHVAYVRNHFPTGTLAVHRTSGDAGRTWSQEHVLSVGPTVAAYDFAEQLVALGGPHLLALSTEVDAEDLGDLAASVLASRDLTQAPVVLRARRSDDGGRTWSAPVAALELGNGPVRDRERGGSALRSLVRPSVSVGPDGAVHVAGESVAPDGSRTELLVASSTDGGASWLPTRAVAVPAVAMAAAVAVDGAGRMALSWLDLREDRAGDAGLTARWRLALDAGRGGGWSAPQALSPAFDLRLLAPAYVGDQGALVGLRRGFAAATVVGTGRQDPTDVVLSVVRP